ncbi:MAG: hypothetical protein WD875_04440 [Pirellulales bacterium]
MERLTSYFDRPEADVPLGSFDAPSIAPGVADGVAAGNKSQPTLPQPTLPPTSQPISPATAKRPVSPELAALRWMVRGFFVAFAVLRLLDACGVKITLAGELSVLVGGLLIIAHMAATVIGTTRRNAAPDELPADRAAWLIERRRLVARRTSARLPAPTALRDDHPAGRWLFACIFTGATSAAALMAALTFPAWLRIGMLGVLILELSAATIGAYFGYMAGRLTATARRAWIEATAEVRASGNMARESSGG